MSWLDYIGNAISKFFAESYGCGCGCGCGGECCFPVPDTERNEWSWDYQEKIGEWAWEHREEIGEAIEIGKAIIDWIPDDTFDN
ncbi:hypothetical protein [Succinimonas sp.]|uniref:hypothetical protein n=1 Tax=Succinimonas sp. TaxID=1936151 RepID=UPI00386DFD73